MIDEPDALNILAAYAREYTSAGLSVRNASVAHGESQDGTPLTRVLLLLTDPTGDTWDLDEIDRLRDDLARRAAELQLPSVTITLVAESEPEATEAFSDEHLSD